MSKKNVKVTNVTLPTQQNAHNRNIIFVYTIYCHKVPGIQTKIALTHLPSNTIMTLLFLYQLCICKVILFLYGRNNVLDLFFSHHQSDGSPHVRHKAENQNMTLRRRADDKGA